MIHRCLILSLGCCFVGPLAAAPVPTSPLTTYQGKLNAFYARLKNYTRDKDATDSQKTALKQRQKQLDAMIREFNRNQRRMGRHARESARRRILDLDRDLQKAFDQFNADLKRLERRRKDLLAERRALGKVPASALYRPSTAKTLTATANKLSNVAKYKAGNGLTHCSEYVRDYFKDLWGRDVPELKGQVRNQMDALSKSKNWTDLGFAKAPVKTFAKAQELANKGVPVIIGWKNPTPSSTNTGHIAVVVPGKRQHSKSWAMSVPQISQAGAVSRVPAYKGKSVFAKVPLSVGFGKSKKAGLKIFIPRR